jgi:putative ABC transport system permease protein
MNRPLPDPPRWAETLARLATGEPAWSDGIGGDLREEFVAIGDTRGAARARWWYRAQALELARDAAASRWREIASAIRSIARPTGDPHMRSLLQEIRPAVRSLARQPLVTGVILVTLAIGLGANAAVFGMVDALVLRPFPFEDVDDLVMFAENSPDNPYPQYEVAPANFKEWREQATSFTAMAAFTDDSVNMAGTDRAERVAAAVVSGKFFELLGIRPALGRLLNAADEPEGSHQQAVISDGLWNRRFGGEPNVLGRIVRLEGEPFTVVGVAPRGFDFPSGSDVWTPLGYSEEEWAERRSHYLTAIGRLKPGVTFEQAAAEMTAVYGRQREAFPDETRDRSLVTRTFTAGMIDIGLLPILSLWQAAAVFVLIIGCANVANLLLARGAARRRELSVRAAIGASRGRLIRQLLVESLVLAVAATPLALVVSAVTFGAVRAAMPGELVRFIAGWLEMGVDLRLALVTLASAAAAAVLFGLLPALQVSRPDLGNALKDGGRSVSASRHWLRRGLVVAQLALAVPLLVASGMSALGAQRFASGPQGFDPNGTLRLVLVLPETDYPDAESRRLLTRRLLDGAANLPGVVRAASATAVPSGTSNQRRDLVIDGRPVDPNRTPPLVNYRAVSPGYFDVMRIPVRRGRAVDARDREDAEPVAVISQSMADRHWPDASPIGARLQLGDDVSRWWTVVGIAGDTIDDWFGSRNSPTVYVPVEQAPSAVVNLVLRSDDDPALLAEPARRLLANVDPTLAPFQISTMTEAVRVRTTGLRFVGGMMAGFGLVALALAAIGIYSVMAYYVAQRRQEIGIRMALGASARDVLVGTLSGGGRMALLGIAIGLALGLLLARVVENLLFGVVAMEPWLMAAIAGLLGAVALLASLVPARQAARVDPVIALRAD